MQWFLLEGGRAKCVRKQKTQYFKEFNHASCLFLKLFFAVHKLRPSDIQVVAALGDSITVSVRTHHLVIIHVKNIKNKFLS